MSRARDLADGTFSGAFSADSPTLVVDDTNNRVGVGTASPSSTLVVKTGTNQNIEVRSGSDVYGSGVALDALNDARTSVVDLTLRGTNLALYGSGSTPMTFHTDSTERARISDGGNFFVGATAAFNNNVDSGVEVRPTSLRIGSNQYVDNIMCCTAHTGTKYFLSFYQNGTFVGSITGNGSNTAFNTSSDYRLKENVVDLDGAIDRVKQIPVRQFNFIDKPDRTVDGFLAHEVQAVVPEAVTGTKDEVDDDGNPKYQGIDQSKLVPLLTAAIKEQQALIEDLQTRLAALEAV